MTISDMVQIDPRARRAFPHLPATAPAGSWWIGPTGERIRINADGSVDEVGEMPRRWSVSADPCNAVTPETGMTDICPRCGRAGPSVVALATVATRADAALRNRGLAVPDIATDGLHAVAAALRCHAGVCGGEHGSSTT